MFFGVGKATIDRMLEVVESASPIPFEGDGASQRVEGFEGLRAVFAKDFALCFQRLLEQIFCLRKTPFPRVDPGQEVALASVSGLSAPWTRRTAPERVAGAFLHGS